VRNRRQLRFLTARSLLPVQLEGIPQCTLESQLYPNVIVEMVNGYLHLSYSRDERFDLNTSDTKQSIGSAPHHCAKQQVRLGGHLHK